MSSENMMIEGEWVTDIGAVPPMSYDESIAVLKSVTPVTRQWRLIIEATAVIHRNMHRRSAWVKGNLEHQAAFNVAAGFEGMEADGFSLRRFADGSSPDDDE